MKVGPGDPGAFLLHAETTRQYAAQMCAEYTDEKGAWVCPKHKANHLWDCEVYGFAAADFQGVQYRPREDGEPEAPAAPTAPPQTINPSARRRAPW